MRSLLTSSQVLACVDRLHMVMYYVQLINEKKFTVFIFKAEIIFKK